MSRVALLPGTGGLLAVSTRPGLFPGPDLDRAMDRVGAPDAARSLEGTVRVASWGALRRPSVGSDPILLNLISRGPGGDVAPPDLRSGRDGDRLLPDLMPPFAALQVADDVVSAVTDAIGFRHLYYRAEDGWSAVSTSTRALAALSPTRLDRMGIGFQSVLGWQIGDRTLFDGVRKLREGERIVLAGGRARLERYLPETREPTPQTNATAIPEAADLLRGYLDGYLDEHPDAVLQLTGGIDSRILLAAIDPARRRGLRALTLEAAPGSEDVRIAARAVPPQRDGTPRLRLRGAADARPRDGVRTGSGVGRRARRDGRPPGHGRPQPGRGTGPSGPAHLRARRRGRPRLLLPRTDPPLCP